MSDPSLWGGLNYELLFLESLKLVVRPGHPLLQDTVTLSRVMEWPVVVSPKGTVPRQNAETLLQMQGCSLPSGCIETLSASLSRQLTVDYDYVWFVPSGAVKDDLRQGTLTALPVTSPGAGEPIGILTRVDTPLSRVRRRCSAPSANPCLPETPLQPQPLTRPVDGFFVSVVKNAKSSINNCVKQFNSFIIAANSPNGSHAIC